MAKVNISEIAVNIPTDVIDQTAFKLLIFREIVVYVILHNKHFHSIF
jgi:hypothetical protein